MVKDTTDSNKFKIKLWQASAESYLCMQFYRNTGQSTMDITVGDTSTSTLTQQANSQSYYSDNVTFKRNSAAVNTVSVINAVNYNVFSMDCKNDYGAQTTKYCKIRTT